MFVSRQELPTNEELARQSEMLEVLLYGKKPTTFIQKKTAAISGHRKIDAILQAKIYKSLDTILNMLSENKENDPNVHIANRDKILNFIQTQPLEIGTIFTIPQKLPSVNNYPLTNTLSKSSIIYNTTQETSVNIGEFEIMCFKNMVKFRYMRDTSFASYMYQNLLYSLNAKTSKDLISIDSWQARLALLIEQLEFNDFSTMEAFYNEKIIYKGVIYDTSFVPNYDVRNIEPEDPIDIGANDQEMIEFYYKFNERAKMTIPTKMMGIFLVFPFKNGHYIRPTGEIVHLNLKSYSTLKSSRITISNLCDMYDIESAIENESRTMPLDDAIYYAVYSKSLREQAIALMIIRRLVGNVLIIGRERIELPSELNILSWSRQQCSERALVLPRKYISKDADVYLHLIRDLAASCISKRNAAIMCSSYSIPEMHITNVYEKLKNDAEKYILFTLILQNYRIDAYLREMKRLKPTFGNSTFDILSYPTDKNFEISRYLGGRCVSKHDKRNFSRHTCPELYEFSDPYLKLLARDGNVQLDNPKHLANFIVLSIT